MMMQSYGWNLQRLQHSRNINSTVQMRQTIAQVHLRWLILVTVCTGNTVQHDVF